MCANKPETVTKTPPPRWTEQDVATLIELWSKNMSNAEIAKKLGRPESAIAVKASRINLPRRSELGKTTKARVRPCLRCEKPFYSTGAGNRFCDPCKESSDWQNGGDYFSSIGGV